MAIGAWGFVGAALVGAVVGGLGGIVLGAAAIAVALHGLKVSQPPRQYAYARYAMWWALLVATVAVLGGGFMFLYFGVTFWVR